MERCPRFFGLRDKEDRLGAAGAIMKAPSISPSAVPSTPRLHGTWTRPRVNSLDAQYDAASAYIKSQAHAG